MRLGADVLYLWLLPLVVAGLVGGCGGGRAETGTPMGTPTPRTVSREQAQEDLREAAERARARVDRFAGQPAASSTQTLITSSGEAGRRRWSSS